MHCLPCQSSRGRNNHYPMSAYHGLHWFLDKVTMIILVFNTNIRQKWKAGEFYENAGDS